MHKLKDPRFVSCQWSWMALCWLLSLDGEAGERRGCELMSMTVQQCTQTVPNVDRPSLVFHSLLDCRLGPPSSRRSFDCIVKWCDDGGDENSRPSTLFSLLYKALTSLCVRDRRNRGIKHT